MANLFEVDESNATNVTSCSSQCLHIFNLCSQLTKYSEGLALQALLADRRKSGTFPDSLLLLQVVVVADGPVAVTSQNFEHGAHTCFLSALNCSTIQYTHLENVGRSKTSRFQC
eukprot:1159259-Pelagomonas_calceolata.AAC.1